MVTASVFGVEMGEGGGMRTGAALAAPVEIENGAVETVPVKPDDDFAGGVLKDTAPIGAGGVDGIVGALKLNAGGWAVTVGPCKGAKLSCGG